MLIICVQEDNKFISARENLMNRTRPYLNRFVKLKEQEIEDSYHSTNLKEIKPITSKYMEHSDTIIINNSKREMIKQVREIEIERENKLLLQKIASVMSKKGTYSVIKTKNIRSKVNKSLNEIYRKRQMENIELQNKRFVHRLQNKKPTVNIDKLNKDWVDNKGTIRRMANAEFNLTNIKSSSRVHSITNDKFYKTRFDKLKIMKIRTIDGQKFVLRIEFTDELLKIVGDPQDSKDIKIIEIPKEEALIFIETECKGRIEQLIQKLKYDARSETLYLMSEQLEDGEADFGEFNPEIEAFQNNKRSIERKNVEDSRKNKSALQTKNRTIKQKSKQSVQKYSQQSKTISVTDQKEEMKSIQKKDQKKVKEAEKKTEEIAIPHHNQAAVEQKKVHLLKKQQIKQVNQRVQEHKQEKMQPQQQQYQEQKFQQSQNVPKAELPAPVQAKVEKKQQSKEKQIIVQPQELQDYNQQFEASGQVVQKSGEKQQINRSP